MQRIRQLLTLLSRKIKQRLPIRKKPFRELVALSLNQISGVYILILFMVWIFSVLAVIEHGSEVNINSVNAVFNIYSGVSFMVFLMFNAFYVEPRIISKIDNFSPSSKYNILKAHSLYGKIGWIFILFSFVFATTWSLLNQLFSVVPESVYDKTSVLFGTFPSFLLLFGFIHIMFVGFMNVNKELELTFSVIQDFETIPSESRQTRYLPPIYPSEIWNFCMRQIVYRLEERMIRHTGISKDCILKFYEPFNTVSLAFFSWK